MKERKPSEIRKTDCRGIIELRIIVLWIVYVYLVDDGSEIGGDFVVGDGVSSCALV